MLTAIEAKLTALRTKHHFTIVENKISNAANRGDLFCILDLNEIPDGNMSMLYEISCLLYELGYRTVIEERTLVIYWSLNPHICYNDLCGDIDEDEKY